ncbi:MAG TPA: ParB/RepB/Spo0J family partition protein [Verrucomicrobiae bacterium]|nr:ParB/RepB/Spo0J family partition protein [Verrucomicrobiae bacterium]
MSDSSSNWYPNNTLSINGEQISDEFDEIKPQANINPGIPSPTQTQISGPTLTQVPVSKIKPNPWQPRKIFKEEYLQELASSIKEHGILQPLVVVPTPDGNYQLIVGERRLRASQLAGLTTVPVIVRDAMEEQQKLELALIENIQRHNLDPIEEAQAYQQLIDHYKLTQEEVAKKVGKGRTTVTNLLRLLNLPLKVQRAVAEGTITEGHARPLVTLPGMEKQLAMLDEIIKENMTVRQVEERVRQFMERPKQVKAPRLSSDPEVAALETELRGKLGTKVKVQKSGDSGKIMIEFYSQEELQGLIDKISQLS